MGKDYIDSCPLSRREMEAAEMLGGFVFEDLPICEIRLHYADSGGHKERSPRHGYPETIRDVKIIERERLL